MNKHIRSRYPQGMFRDRITLDAASKRKLERVITGLNLYPKYYLPDHD